MRLRRPFIDPRKGPPYTKATYDPAYDLAVDTPGTPQFNYARYRGALGWIHRCDDVRDLLRRSGRMIGFWSFVTWQIWVFYVALFR